jgi:hypothetical protein
LNQEKNKETKKKFSNKWNDYYQWRRDGKRREAP